MLLHTPAAAAGAVGDEISAICDCDGHAGARADCVFVRGGVRRVTHACPRSSRLVVADDAGTLTVFDLLGGGGGGAVAPARVIRAHESICAAVVWVPPGRGAGGAGALVSGGLDSQVCVWYAARAHAAARSPPPPSHGAAGRCRRDAATGARRLGLRLTSDDAGGASLSNPPFVHALALGACGAAVAVASGDGAQQPPDCAAACGVRICGVCGARGSRVWGACGARSSSSRAA